MHVSYTYNAYTHSLPSSSAVTCGSSGTGVARWRQPGRWSSMTFVRQSHRVKSEFGNRICQVIQSDLFIPWLEPLERVTFSPSQKGHELNHQVEWKNYVDFNIWKKSNPNKDRKKTGDGFWLKLKECDFIVWNKNWNRNFSQGPPDIFKDLLTWVAQKLL